MKTLIVYDKNENIIFTSKPADSEYKLIVEDVPDDKEIVGIDNDNLILKNKELIHEDNIKLQKELKEKELENEELTDKIIELTAQNLEDK